MKTRTLANLSHWSLAKIERLRRVLRDETLPAGGEGLMMLRRLPHGHVAAALGTARKIRLDRLLAVGAAPARLIAPVLAMIVPRVIDPASKPSTARQLGASTASCSRGPLLEALAAIMEGEKSELLLRVIEGDGRIAANIKSGARNRQPARFMPMRTVGALRMRARRSGKARERANAGRRDVERRRRAEETEKARHARPKAVKHRGEGVWRKTAAEIERRMHPAMKRRQIRSPTCKHRRPKQDARANSPIGRLRPRCGTKRREVHRAAGTAGSTLMNETKPGRMSLDDSAGTKPGMLRREKRWVRVKPLTKEDKGAIAAVCECFIANTLKLRFLPSIRPTEFNYPVDIFGRWRGNKYSFITRYRSGFRDNLGEEFDAAFTRFDHVEEHLAGNCFDVMWHRHTGQWFRLYAAVSLDEALHLVATDELLQPVC